MCEYFKGGMKVVYLAYTLITKIHQGSYELATIRPVTDLTPPILLRANLTLSSDIPSRVATLKHIVDNILDMFIYISYLYGGQHTNQSEIEV